MTKGRQKLVQLARKWQRGLSEAAMSEVFPVPETVARASHCDHARYMTMYRRSIEDFAIFMGSRKVSSWAFSPTPSWGTMSPIMAPSPV